MFKEEKHTFRKVYLSYVSAKLISESEHMCAISIQIKTQSVTGNPEASPASVNTHAHQG